MCIICSVGLKTIQETEDHTLGITLFHPVPVPPRGGAVAHLGEDGFCLSIRTHICDVHGGSSSCRLNTYKNSMGGGAIVRGFQIKVLLS
jgi:hypothetical protein